MRKPLDAIIVRWLDSTGQDGWAQASDIDGIVDGVECMTVGLVVRDDPAEDVIVVALAASGVGGYFSPLAIPRVAIRDMHVVPADEVEGVVS